MKRNVWITGIGIVSAIGTGLDTHRDAAQRGRSGLARQSFFNGAAPDPMMCGMVPHETLPMNLPESAHNRADLLLDLALKQALVHSGLNISGEAGADLIAGTTLGNMAGAGEYYRALRKNEPADLALVKHCIPCAPLLWAAKENGIIGKCLTVSSACGSGLAALGQAFLRIQAGRADCVIAGGFDALSPFVIAGFNSLRLVSSKECRPFDANRDGLNPGEGAAMLVLESEQSARARGAVPLARIDAFGESLDAYHHTRAHPEGRGIVEAATRAFASADIPPATIDHIHLHGTGTPANDTSEYNACAALFGERLPYIPACSTKSMTGHTFGAAGAINTAFSVISLTSGLIPPTLFLKDIDPQCTHLSVSALPRSGRKIHRVLTCALGFGGESFALVLSKVGK